MSCACRGVSGQLSTHEMAADSCGSISFAQAAAAWPVARVAVHWDRPMAHTSLLAFSERPGLPRRATAMKSARAKKKVGVALHRLALRGQCHSLAAHGRWTSATFLPMKSRQFRAPPNEKGLRFPPAVKHDCRRPVAGPGGRKGPPVARITDRGARRHVSRSTRK